jgi:catechol 2,3-dioxygenase-like lactoylglutathione lyase family enzyme
MKAKISKPSLIIVIIIFMSLSHNVAAQDTVADNDRHSFSLTLQHTTLVVSDFETSKKFYTELLMLEEISADWLPENQMFISLGNNLELHVGEVEGVEISPNGFNHFAVSTSDLDAFLVYLRENGIVYSSLGGANEFFVQEREDGVRQTFIQDPDGYWIEINDVQ